MRGKPFTTGDDRINKGGRPKNVPNRSTDELRVLLHNFIDSNLQTLQSDYNSLEAKDRLTFIERLIKWVLPAPLSELERLTEDQLDELINRLKKQQQ